MKRKGSDMRSGYARQNEKECRFWKEEKKGMKSALG